MVDLGLVLHRSSPAELVVYTDTEWVGCPDTRRSTSGYATFLDGKMVSWSSKRQPVVSRSSAEVEYRVVANGVAEASWLRQLLAKLHSPLAKNTLVYCDNVSVVYLSTNPVQHQVINGRSMWRLTCTLFETELLSVMFGFSMSRLPPSLPTSSPRACPPRLSRSFAPASK
jgi:hypothetical protein